MKTNGNSFIYTKLVRVCSAGSISFPFATTCNGKCSYWVRHQRPHYIYYPMRGFFHSVLKMSSEEVNSVLLQACHRLPGVVKNKRRVIIRLSSLLVRDEILTYAMGLRRGSRYSVVADVSPSMSIFRTRFDFHPRNYSFILSLASSDILSSKSGMILL
jgi:hypothetical protein